MTSQPHSESPRRSAPHRRRRARRRRNRILAALTTAALATIALAAASPPPETAAALMDARLSSISQVLQVSDVTVAPTNEPRGAYSATPGIATLVAGGTNHDWAKLVLLSGGYPMTDENVTVLLRWMRQENGVDNWWNRDNPLNNGYGSGGGGGTGRYASLVIAAQKCAEALGHNPGYRGIVDALMASSPTEVTEAAIWASPWASGHYANGGHWHYSDVPAVKAPAEAWG